MSVLPDLLPESLLALRKLSGLPASALPSPGALLRLTALQSLALIGPFDRQLELPAGLRSLRADSTDDMKASSFVRVTSCRSHPVQFVPDSVAGGHCRPLCSCQRMHNVMKNAMRPARQWSESRPYLAEARLLLNNRPRAPCGSLAKDTYCSRIVYLLSTYNAR